MKKIRSLSIALVLIGSLILAGCNGPKSEPTGSEKLQKPAAQKVAKAPVKKAEPKSPAPKLDERREDAGRLEVDTLVYDFGEVEPGSSVEGKFVLTNTGKEVIELNPPGKSCGCTLTKLKTNVLQPGESTDLGITFKAGDHPGKTSKKLWVTTKAPSLPERITMSLTADIKQHIKNYPENYKFELRDNAQAEPLVLESTDGQEFKVTGATVMNDAVELLVDREASSTRHEIPLKLNVDVLREKPAGVITVNVDHPKVKTCRVSYSSLLPFTASPQTKSFLRMVPGQEQGGAVKIVSNFGEDFELGTVASEKGLVKVVSTAKVEDGYQINITMQAPSEEDGRKIISDYLIVEIKDRPADTIKVRCYGRTMLPRK